MALTPIFGKKNILVTGGAGFIGSHLCERAVKDAHVICVDDFSNSTPQNIAHLLRDQNFALIKADVTAPLDLGAFPELEKFKVKFQGVQEIYHLACPTTAKNFDQVKIATLMANSAGVRTALEIAVQWKSKVVFGSSSVVYGPRRADRPAFKEEDEGMLNHLSPRGCYDEGKRFAETMCATYAQVHGVDAKIARIFRAYGPRLKLYDGQMLSDFVVDALDGKDLVIYGDETFTTSLTYVTDVVDGLVRVMASPQGIGPVNLGSDRVYRLLEVAEMIVKMTGSSSQVRFEAPLQFITPLGIPDITKAKNDLGWLPLVSLEEGLKRLIEYTEGQKRMVG